MQCPNGFPSLVSYKSLTPAMAATAKHGLGTASNLATIGSCTAHITAVLLVITDDLDNGVYSTESERSVHPSNISLLFLPSLACNVLLDRPAVPCPKMAHVLIDDGAQLVLINNSLVCALGLCVYQLPLPIPLVLAFSYSPSSPTSLLAAQCVKHSIISPDSQFRSQSVWALIAPDTLYVDVILSLPFLSHNCIIVDSAAHTAVSQLDSYDFLNPPIHTKVTHSSHTLMTHHIATVYTSVISELDDHLLMIYSHIDQCSCHLSVSSALVAAAVTL